MSDEVQPRALPPLMIRASAGSGKTYQLANRYLQLLFFGVPAETILATTFTKKAAKEIAERIFDKLSEAATDEAVANKMADELALPQLDVRLARGVLKQFVHSQHRLQISTLDSLFFSIASIFPFELGLAPGWRILSDENRLVLFEQALLKVCKSSKLATVLPLILENKSSALIHSRLTNFIWETYQLASRVSSDAWASLEVPNAPDDSLVRQALAGLPRIELPKTISGSVNKNFIAAVEKLCSDAESGDWIGVLNNGLSKCIIAQNYSYYRTPLPTELQAALAPVVEKARHLVLGDINRLSAAYQAICSLFDEVLMADKFELGVLDFDDVKRLISRQRLVSTLDELYFRLDSRIQHLLLDEFQDTSAAEWQGIEPIVEEVLAVHDPGRSFFCVGDTKQAIYGWRGGVAEIFEGLNRRFPQLEVLPSDTSWRSAQAIIQTVNAVFSNLPQNFKDERDKAIAAQWSSGFNLHQANRSEEGFATVVEYDGTDENTAVHATARLVQQLLQAGATGSIGVLVRRRDMLREVLFALHRAGISASGEGGNPLTDSETVEAVLSLLTLVDHPQNLLAAFHVASTPLGPFVGLDDAFDGAKRLKVSREIRQRLLAEGYGQVLLWVQKAFIDLSLRDKRRMWQLVEFAFSVDRSASLRPRLFVRAVKTKRVESAFDSQVRVMTIHAAKGLEFDCVVLPELEARLLGIKVDRLVLRSSDPLRPPDRILKRPTERQAHLSPEIVQILEDNRAQRLKDALSVLYVALTRAKDALYMLVEKTPANDQQTFARILRNSLLGERAQYQLGNPKWYLQSKCEVQNEASVAPKSGAHRSKLAYVFCAKSQTLHVTPSTLVAEKEVLGDEVLRLKNPEQLLRGRAIHRLLESVAWIEDFRPNSERIKQIVRSFCPRDGADVLLEEFKAILENSQMRSLLSRSRYSQNEADKVELYLEQRFAYKTNKTLVSGSFDRLVVQYRHGKAVSAEVIDFKTDSLVDNSRLEFYRPQLEAYRAAAAHFAGVPDENVTWIMHFVTQGVSFDSSS